MSDSVRPHRQQPTRLPHSWDSTGKNTEVGCHFPLQCMKVRSESEVSQSCLTQRSHGLQPTRLLRPWDFPGKSTGVGCHCLLLSCGYLVIIPVYQNEHGGKGGRFTELVDCRAHGSGKSQWATGEVAAVISFQSTVPTQRKADPALIFQPCVWCVFSTVEQKRTKPARTKVVCSTLS